MWRGLTGARDEASVDIFMVRRGNSSERFVVVEGDRRDPTDGVSCFFSVILHIFLFVYTLHLSLICSFTPYYIHLLTNSPTKRSRYIFTCFFFPICFLKIAKNFKSLSLLKLKL